MLFRSEPFIQIFGVVVIGIESPDYSEFQSMSEALNNRLDSARDFVTDCDS